MEELEFLPIPLLQWYRDNARVLPWRPVPGSGVLGEPYRVWVSEIMLQQTRVAAVLDYYRRFMDELPTVLALAEVHEDRLMKLWQGLGYYNRARNLQKAARQVMERGGVFPDTYEGLLELAGVGEYTAGAIASIAFGRVVPAVDGNVLRVVARITGDDGDILKQETKRRMGRALLAVMPRQDPGDFNQALMELGATVCLPNGAPLCETCPAGALCRARREDSVAALPVKTPKKPRRVEERTVYLLFRAGRVALRRRGEKGLLAGLWEYPNELDGGPDPLAEWGVTPLSVRQLGPGKHIFTHIEWRMQAVGVQAATDTLPQGWVWADEASLRGVYALPSAFRGFEAIVIDHMRGES